MSAKLEPDTLSYNSGISACEKCTEWEHALWLLGEALEAKLELTIISYNAGVSACGRSGQWQRGLSLLCELRAAMLKADVIQFVAQRIWRRRTVAAGVVIVVQLEGGHGDAQRNKLLRCSKRLREGRRMAAGAIVA
ncbi:unnamed protein product [Prorocentrum cordatum]|uniref:Uncharacterized protein n=1 Tax=Prorocentrum cordatum TaxID=2364126 RepID=A0ABN9PCU0_9DINO|nr:unnamed protein product [Polarella glacialis]